ncbi:MAG: AMP-binding protein [Clostridia bacterium]|nr:AMP-binding protein [Clostridia bacterium]
MENLLYQCTDYKNIREIMNEINQKFSNDIAFTLKKKDENQKVTYQDITYKTFLKQINYLGTAYIDFGLKDSRIAIIGKNRYEWILNYIAVINGTGVVVPLDKSLPKEEIETSLIRAKVTSIICEKDYINDLKDMIKNGKTELKNIICMDDVSDDGVLLMSNFLKKGKELLEKKKDKRFVKAKIDNDKMATIIFTSGTTSASKAVMLSHRNIASVVYAINSAEKIYNTDTNFCILPFHHTFGSTGILFMMSNGSRNVFCDGLRHIQENIVEYGVSVFIAVPLLIESMDKKIWKAIEKQGKTKLVKRAMKISNFLMKLHIDIRKKLFKQIHEQLGGKLRFVVNGAAALDKNVAQDFYSWGFDVVQGYGLTETSPVLAGENIKKFRFGSIGFAMVNVDIKIDDPDENGIGELVATGPNVMLGYYEDEEATNKIIDVDADGKRWIHTGDLAYMDKDGFIFITGRKKNVIVLKNGKNVFPEELESVINKLPYVVESMVFGYPKEDDLVVSCKVVYDKEYFEKQLAFTDENSIKDHIWKDIKEINSGLSKYKYIKKLYISDEPMIKTSTAKIKRYQEIEKLLKNEAK